MAHLPSAARGALRTARYQQKPAAMLNYWNSVVRHWLNKDENTSHCTIVVDEFEDGSGGHAADGDIQGGSIRRGMEIRYNNRPVMHLFITQSRDTGKEAMLVESAADLIGHTPESFIPVLECTGINCRLISIAVDGHEHTLTIVVELHDSSIKDEFDAVQARVINAIRTGRVPPENEGWAWDKSLQLFVKFGGQTARPNSHGL